MIGSAEKGNEIITGREINLNEELLLKNPGPMIISIKG
jgi:hypothetical protein